MNAAASPEPVLPTTRRGWQAVVGLLVLAAVARFGLVGIIRGDYLPQTDALQFDQLATQIAHGHGFTLDPPQPGLIGPSALRAPGYPALLAAVYVVAGDHSWTAALLVNALLGVAGVAIVGLLTSQLLGRRAGLLALAIAAIYPPVLLTGSSLQLEPAIVVLCFGGLAAALQHRRAPRGLLWPIVAGVCLGLGVLTREQAAFFLPVVAWLLWTADGRSWPSWKDKANLRAAVVVVAVAVLSVAPWTIRNYVQLDSFVPVTTSAGFGLVGTYNETSLANRGRWLPPYNDPRSADVLVGLDDPTEVRVDAAFRDLTLDVIKEHPTAPVEVAFWNTLRGFDLDGGAYTRLIAPYLPYPTWLLDPAVGAGLGMLALAAFGTRTRRVRTVPLAIWIIPITLLGFMVVFLPFSIRYRSLIEPFTILLASAALLAGIDRWGPAAWRESPSGGPRRTRPLVAGPTVDLPHVPPARDRSRNLDVLRAIAALMVLWGHASHLSGETVPFVSKDAGEAILNILVGGVWLFFAISGYVISRSFVRSLLGDRELPSIGGYAIRRVARIFPLYWVALAVTIGAVGVARARAWDLAAHLALLHNLLPSRQQAILPAAWTLSLELLFYISVPLAAVAAARSRRRRGSPFTAEELAGWVLLAWVGSVGWTVLADSVGNTNTGLWLRQLFPSMLGMFCPGILLAIAECARPGSWLQQALAWMERRRGAVWGLAAALLLLAGSVTFANPDDGIFRYLLIRDGARVPYALGFGLVVGLARTSPRWTSAPARALARTGDWSYGVYLLQAVWFYGFLDRYPNVVPLQRGGIDAFVVHAIFLSTLTIPSAWAVHRLLERPAMAWGARQAERWRASHLPLSVTSAG